MIMKYLEQIRIEIFREKVINHLQLNPILKRVETHSVCWFCDEPCEKFWYWHVKCKDEWMEKNK